MTMKTEPIYINAKKTGTRGKSYAKEKMRKFSLSLAIALVASILAFSCSPNTIDEQVWETMPLEPDLSGVYFAFSGGGGTPQMQSINLSSISVANPIFNNLENEQAFFSKLHELFPGKYSSGAPTSYDYKADPDGVGHNTATNLYSLGDDKKKYKIINLPSEPKRPSYNFYGWEITGVESPLTGVFAVSSSTTHSFLDPATVGGDGANVGFLLDSPLAKKSKAYLTLTAKWELTGDAAQKLDDLANEIKALEDKANSSSNAEFSDEFVVGQPVTEGQVAAFSEAMAAAEQVLEGEIVTDTVEISGEYCQEEDGTYTDQNGVPLVYNAATGLYFDVAGKSYRIEDLPLPAVAIISYKEINIEAANAALALLRTFEGLDIAGYIKGVSIIPADSNVHSVTIAKTGIYEIELLGASGGANWGRDTNGRGDMDGPGGATALGGYGGHVKGRVALESGDVIQFRVGISGTGTAKYDPGKVSDKFSRNTETFIAEQQGGWPNGGKGGSGSVHYNDQYPAGGSGGGSSDVFYVGKNGGTTYSATYNEASKIWTPYALPSIDKRFMVAAGGGGAVQSRKIDVRIANTGFGIFPAIRGGNAGEGGIRTGQFSKGPAENEKATYTYKGNADTPKIYNTYTDVDNVKRYWGVLFTPLNDIIDASRGVPGSNSSDVGVNGTPNGAIYEGGGGGGGGWRGGGAWDQYWPGDAILGTGQTGSGAGGSNYINTGSASTGKNFVGTGSSAGKIVIDTTYADHNGGDENTYISKLYGNGSAKITFIE
jgi:hypothetical protein